MNIIEASRKLDMEVKIAINSYEDIFRWSKLHNVTMSVFLGSDPDNHYFRIFISKKNNKGVEDLIANYFNAIEKEEYFMITKLISDNIYNLIHEIGNIPSVALLETTIEMGKFIIRLRYNSDYKSNVSEIINRYITIPNFIDDLLITKSETGIDKFLLNKNKKIPLSVLKYTIPLDRYNMTYTEKMLEKTDSIAEAVGLYGDDDYFDVLIFSNEKIQEGENLKCISDKNNIYESHLNLTPLSGVRKRTNEHGIFRNFYISIKDNSIHLTFIISSYRIMEYIKILISEAIENNGKNIITIKTCSDYDPSLLN